MKEQDKPGTAGNRLLWYDVTNGGFKLAMFSYANIYCSMDFSLYPFDTQKCNFKMMGGKSANNLVNHNFDFFFIVS